MKTQNSLLLCRQLVALCSASALLVACNDSFMDLKPQTEITADNFFNTEEDLKLYCYGLIDTPDYSYVEDAGTDDQATTDNVIVKNIMLSANANATTINAGWDWNRLYKINFFLENCSRAQVPADVLAHYEGIGRYYRAEFYMDMVKKYSDLPWIDCPLSTTDERLFASREGREQIVERIFDDYRYAAQHVLTKQPQGAVNRWIVMARMARQALYEGTYRKYHAELGLQSSAGAFIALAEQTAREIMDQGGFALYTTGHPESDYASLFNSEDLSANPEMIEAHYYQRNVAENGIWGAYMFGNYIPCPTKALVQAYLMKDGSYYSSQQDFAVKQFVEEFADRDPRMAQTLAYPGWELIGTMNYAPGAGTYVQTLNKNFTGYHQIKGFPNSKNQDYYLSIDYPTIRYAEILLIYAEARAEEGNLTQEDLDQTVNLIRDRAGMPHLSLNVAADPEAQRQFPGVPAVLLEIRRERRVELAFEGFRFDDLMRWHAGKLLEKVPEGLYFPSLGKFDLTGDGIADIYLVPADQEIPAEADKEANSLGVKLVYYRTAGIDNPSATVYLSEGNRGTIVTAKTMGTFTEPRDYYRPVPRHEVELNPALLPQLFGWE